MFIQSKQMEYLKVTNYKYDRCLITAHLIHYNGDININIEKRNHNTMISHSLDTDVEDIKEI